MIFTVITFVTLQMKEEFTNDTVILKDIEHLQYDLVRRKLNSVVISNDDLINKMIDDNFNEVSKSLFEKINSKNYINNQLNKSEMLILEHLKNNK